MKSIDTKLSTLAGSSKSSTNANSSQVEYEENQSDHFKTSTPTQSKGLLPQLCSPILSQSTIQGNDNVEVVWNWQSPQSKCIQKQKKRITSKNSPKLLLKKYPSNPSNNEIPEFNELNQELQCLADPVETKDDSNLDSVFNDSMDGILLVCSQKVEDKFFQNKLDLKVVELPVSVETPKIIINSEISQTSSSVQLVNNLCSKESNSINNNIAVKSITCTKTETLDKMADDSFDIALQALGDADMDFSFNNLQNKKLKTSPDSLDKEEITSSISTCSITQCTSEEIENKRKQAIEKLQRKKSSSSIETSPLKCSQEEIEKKRLQAIAKLEAKKKQDLIEKNRREALKRLEINKKRRALQSSVLVQPVKLFLPKK